MMNLKKSNSQIHLQAQTTKCTYFFEIDAWKKAKTYKLMYALAQIVRKVSGLCGPATCLNEYYVLSVSLWSSYRGFQ